MLAVISPEVGGVATDQKSRYYNVMCSLHALATAAAGSTPVVNPVSSTGTRNTSYNCITVISNTEAGGWSTGTSNGYSSTSTFNVNAGVTWVDLYQTTGKSGYPWYRIGIGSETTPFNNTATFTATPVVNVLAGCTTSSPVTTAFTADVNVHGQTSGASNMTTTVSNGTNNLIRFDVSGDTYTVAVTANYLVIAANSSFYYFGIRTQAPWETTRTDNPPWFSFSYARNSNNSFMTQISSSVSSSNIHAEQMAAWSAGITSTGTQIAASVVGQYAQVTGTVTYTGVQPCAITGQTQNAWANLSGTYVPGYVSKGWTSANAVSVGSYGSGKHINPICDLNSNFANVNANYLIDGPVTDPTTGLNVPPAYPIIMKMTDTTNSASAIGTAPGIYKGMYGTTTTYDTFVTAGEYVIGTDTYVPVRSGSRQNPDLWFLRKA